MTAKRSTPPLWLLLWLLPLGLLGLVISVGIDALRMNPSTESVGPDASRVSNGSFPRTVTESSGRTVLIPRRPMRILAGESGSADVLTALVEPSRLAGWPFTVDTYGGNQAYFTAHPEVQRFQAFNAETLLSLKPDLLLSAAFQDATTMDIVASTGVPVLKFEAFHSWAGIRAWIVALGLAVDEEIKTATLLTFLEQRLKVVEKAVAGRHKPRVLAYANYNGSGSTVGSGETQDEVIRLAGGINASAEAGLKGIADLTFEQMLKIKPDVILVSGNEGQKSQGVVNILSISFLADLPAVRERRFAVIPSRFYDSTTQYLVDAVEVLAKQLHPDAFPATQSATKEGIAP